MGIRVVVLMALVMVLLPFARANAVSLRDGEWSISMTMNLAGDPELAKEMEGAMKALENMPPEARAMMEQMQGARGMKMGMDAAGGVTTTITQCLTSRDPVPAEKEMPGKECEQTHEVNGDAVTFQSVCKGDDFESTQTGETTYNGDTMKGRIMSHVVERGQIKDMTFDITGQYLGPCPDSKTAQ